MSDRLLGRTIVPDPGPRDRIREALNPDLIKKQKLTPSDIERVVDWHLRLQEVMELMAGTRDSEYLHILAQTVESIEYALQEAWRFPRNRNKHSWWLRVPNCRCPQMDNRERWGTKYRIINGSCPVHGDSPKLQ